MADITTPEQFLGFKVGADRSLAGWPQIVKYFQRIEDQTDRLRVTEIGRTTEDHPLLLCTISSSENLKRIDEFQQRQQALSDPRTLDDNQASRAIEEARTVVTITCSIHATEVGATQMSLELAHLLASSDEPRGGRYWTM